MEVCQQVGHYITAQTISFESNYVFKKLRMQDVEVTPVNSPIATDKTDGSACESLQSLENHITALDWIVLLCYMVTEGNLKECVSFCRVM